ncbi:pyrrolo-quinoline quinone, partial [Salinisphaera sp. USBA-960]|nr:pyrrolo-quinoline quinone [Salifodinibacter halophilus]
ADGKIYVASKTGHVTTIKAGADLDVLESTDLDDECYASPALVDARVYLRTKTALYCFRKR